MVIGSTTRHVTISSGKHLLYNVYDFNPEIIDQNRRIEMVTVVDKAPEGTFVIEKGGIEKVMVHLQAPDLRRVKIDIVGTAPLICHRWSEKAKKQILDKQTKQATQAKEAKNPEKDFRASLYVIEGGYGFPSIAFKAAMVRAGTYADMKMTYLRGAFHVEGELVRIEGEPTMRG